MLMAPLAPPDAAPVDNAAAPLVYPSEVFMVRAPDDDDVLPSLVQSRISPPASSLDSPLRTYTMPPTPLVPAPTLTPTSPP